MVLYSVSQYGYIRPIACMVLYSVSQYGYIRPIACMVLYSVSQYGYIRLITYMRSFVLINNTHTHTHTTKLLLIPAITVIVSSKERPGDTRYHSGASLMMGMPSETIKSPLLGLKRQVDKRGERG